MRREALFHLRNILADLFYSNELALDVAAQAGLRRANIDVGSAWTTWGSILTEAENQLCLDELIAKARHRFPRHESLRLAAEGMLGDALAMPDFSWAGPPAAGAGHEVIVGHDDLFPVALLEIGARIAPSVVRIAVGQGRFGSGFLVAPDLILTNHHVLPSIEHARAAVIEFGVEETLDGLTTPGRPQPTLPDLGYAADPADDWAAVRIAPAECDPISLGSSTVAVDDRVFIIQHPGGGSKQVALGINTVSYVGERRLQYLTDTKPGSSGSPVFDRRWRLVGLHHSGGWTTEPGSKRPRFRNEGIAIAVVAAGLRAAGLVRS